MAACVHVTAKVAGISVPATVGLDADPLLEQVKLTVSAGSFPPATIQMTWEEALHFAQTVMREAAAASSLTNSGKGAGGL
tara:strand:+ start:101 stop:340 length:240 start_codon:yes stop_codon:yes gene_type:complete